MTETTPGTVTATTPDSPGMTLPDGTTADSSTSYQSDLARSLTLLIMNMLHINMPALDDKLGEIGRSALDPNPATRNRAITDALNSEGSDVKNARTAFEIVKDRANNDTDPEVHRGALYAIGVMGYSKDPAVQKDAVQILKNVATDEADPQNRGIAIMALGRYALLGDACTVEAAPVIQHAMSDPDPHVRFSALRAGQSLYVHGSGHGNNADVVRETFEMAKTGCHDSDTQVRMKALELVKAYAIEGPIDRVHGYSAEAKKVLETVQLTDPDAKVRAHAADMIADTKQKPTDMREIYDLKFSLGSKQQGAVTWQPKLQN